MSFSIKIMRNSSENNKIGKTLTQVADLSCTLKDGCSVLDPVVLLELTALQASTINYVYIAPFHRYYFIKDITYVRNGLYEISLHVDVLESWKSTILNQAAVIQRQEQNWNLYLDDGQFKTYQDPNIYTLSFQSGFNAQTPCFALAVAGGVSVE